MSGVVIALELALAGLLGFLAVRVVALSRTQPLVMAQPAAPGYPAAVHWTSTEASGISLRATRPRPGSDRTRLVASLHILICLQLRDSRSQGLELAEAPGEVRQYATAWFYGAACALAEPRQRHTEALMETLAGIVANKLALGELEAFRTMVTMTGCSTRLACFRHGLEGAGHWQERHFVPPASSLYNAITSNALV